MEGRLHLRHEVLREGEQWVGESDDHLVQVGVVFDVDARRCGREHNASPAGELAVVVHRDGGAAVLVVDAADAEVQLGGHLDHLAQHLDGLLGRDGVAVAGDGEDRSHAPDVVVVVEAAADPPLLHAERFVERVLPAGLDDDAVEVDDQSQAVARAHIGDLDVFGGFVCWHLPIPSCECTDRPN